MQVPVDESDAIWVRDLTKGVEKLNETAEVAGGLKNVAIV